MAKDEGKRKDALTKTDAPAGTAIMALSADNSGMLAEVIKENFGQTGLRLSDLDRIKVPGSAGTTWEVPTIDAADGDARKVITGVIIAWADKKAWWPKKFGTEGGNTPPSCKSDDMVHGKGLPTLAISDAENELIEAGKIQRQPTQDAGGWLCSTCPHNVFGSTPKETGTGKWCKDMRFIIMLLDDAVLPVLIRVPPTSLLPLRNYFKRLASSGKRYYHTVTSLTLVKDTNAGGTAYSTIVPTAARFLHEDEIGGAVAYHQLMQPMLESEGAVDAGLQDKAGSDEQKAADSPAANASDATTSASIRDVPRKDAADAEDDQTVF